MTFEFTSRRSPVYSLHGGCASSQPLATMAGVDVLKRGGNAVDAAVCMAAVLAVTEPCSTGLGGDAFALFYNAKTKKVRGINGSGRSASRVSLSSVAGQFKHVPLQHGHAVTVPGACAAWMDMLGEWGSLPVADVLAPAVHLAHNGFAVASVTAHCWAAARASLEAPSPFLPVPKAGDVFRNPELAATLQDVVAHGASAIYQGRRARAICDEVARRGGVLALDDLQAHASEFVDPVVLRYRGCIDVFEHPPNGQGVAALMALDAFQALTPAPTAALARHSPERVHLLIECMRSAFADARAHIADPAAMRVDACTLLADPEHKKRRLARVDTARASVRGLPLASSETVSFCAVDTAGNAVSMVNSNYLAFGTGFCPPGCGFSLQNRGANFVLDAAHANCLGPSKRPYHTILPGLSLYAEDASLHSAFNVMGGFMQPVSLPRARAASVSRTHARTPREPCSKATCRLSATSSTWATTPSRRSTLRASAWTLPAALRSSPACPSTACARWATTRTCCMASSACCSAAGRLSTERAIPECSAWAATAAPTAAPLGSRSRRRRVFTCVASRRGWVDIRLRMFLYKKPRRLMTAP